jgi:hypothetical protein
MAVKKRHERPRASKRNPLGRIAATAITVLGLVATVLTLWPRVVVDSSEPVDPKNPLSASFTVINTGYLPLRDVTVLLGVGRIVFGTGRLDPNVVPNFRSRLVRPEWQHHRLAMDERFAVTVGDLFRTDSTARVSAADIAVVVTYKPWLLPLSGEKVFRFVTKRQTDGLLYWYPLPLQ